MFNVPLTNTYKPCGDRCFKSETVRQAWADGANRLYWEPAVAPYDAKCLHCRDFCTDCDDYDTCTTCEAGYVLYTYQETQAGGGGTVDYTVCISEEACNYKEGWFVDTTNGAGNTCTECAQGCLDCITQDDNCTKCSGANNYLTLQSGSTTLYTCASTCNSGYIDTVEQRCLQCAPECDTCTSGDQGNLCADSTDTDSNECGAGYVRVPSSGTPFICTNLCTYGQHVDDTTKTCIDCHESCSDCD